MLVDSASPPRPDDLVVSEVGPWTEDKLKLVGIYAALFSTAMKGKWDCRAYLDLFAGPGVSRIRGSGRLTWGSPFVALGVPDHFDCYVFCEEESSKLAALEQRMATFTTDINVHFVPGDANTNTDEILSKLPPPSRSQKVLTFCLVDPFRMRDLRFETIRTLAAERFIDFLILIPTGMDATRNVDKVYLQPADETVERFLGRPWRIDWSAAQAQRITFDRFLTDSFGASMTELGYRYEGIARTELIRSYKKNLPLYRLAFFSRHPLGERFWRQASKYANAQGSLF